MSHFISSLVLKAFKEYICVMLRSNAYAYISISPIFLFRNPNVEVKCQKSLSPGNENFEIKPDTLSQVKTPANAEIKPP